MSGKERPNCSVSGCERPAVAKMVTPLVENAYRCLLDLEYDIDRDFFEEDPAWDRSLSTEDEWCGNCGQDKTQHPVQRDDPGIACDQYVDPGGERDVE